MSRWSFWSWVDVNWPTFEKDMREKRFLHFRSQWPWHLTSRPRICSPSYCCPAVCVHQIRIFYGFPFSRKSEAYGTDERTDRHTDGQADGVQHLMWPPKEGCIIIRVELNRRHILKNGLWVCERWYQLRIWNAWTVASRLTWGRALHGSYVGRRVKQYYSWLSCQI